jgi:Thermostable hemolysin
MQALAVHDLIKQRYADVYGAVPSTDFPQYCVIDPDDGDGPKAALGLRLADKGPLFLEQYLDRPIEDELRDALGRSFDRSRIVEIGALASSRSRATIALWASTARHLDGAADVAVAVLTGPMRAMFQRLGIAIVELAPADPARLPDKGERWGSYYDLDPIVCAGLIKPARPKLAGWDDSQGHCA